ncbi:MULTISPECIES: SGNH/GDSL hydrolase family protein [Streptomycetaceae]|uniref:Putative secreted protein n=1 Tax=Streptantibioticus cattleyicolor (strain ATCC 35852 / DSM 46488 / JCM 4925 / NBRC 14057 / NRRL 8057) TaxID=1003195 RepID=F8JVG3_STREN|nr:MULTISPECIES: SGNH/GDSL hydrolase family protein [Streptomycetaceae]AEW94452.1 putative secreted protein [Streptantibioticus cattleyicolor NRRL 8057 = DSM 46488]MYS59098.1 SGNH/GDSL hydrolase family protein [Streptomyces sp. SID5468]CCB74808.1 putative secreted protein [Streptantibioticus cattleyicolor NRRL 8057 = DSM 46488]
MARAVVGRRVVAAAAYGGGGIGVLSVAALGLLLTEARLARRTVGRPEGTAPVADGRYGAAFGRAEGPGALRLGFLGDSTAAGLGVRRADETPGAVLASALAAIAERPVDLVNVAETGACSDRLRDQVDQLLDGDGPPPDACVIMVGANDVTHRVPPSRSVGHLAEAVRRLRAAGAGVVVGTCPDLGTIQPVHQPLRWVARRLSRQLAAAQTIAVVSLGARTVSLGQLLGPEFQANPREMFGPDRYHPSATGYATAAMAVLPTLCAVLGLWPDDEVPDTSRGEGILPVAAAAAAAAGEGGTEVAAAGPPGRRGPWVLLRHRRRRRLPEPLAPDGPQPEPGSAHTGGGAD